MTQRFILEMPWTETLWKGMNESVELSLRVYVSRAIKHVTGINGYIRSVSTAKPTAAVVFNKIMTSRLKRKLGEIGVDTSSRKVNENFCLVCEFKCFTFELAI